MNLNTNDISKKQTHITNKRDLTYYHITESTNYTLISLSFFFLRRNKDFITEKKTAITLFVWGLQLSNFVFMIQSELATSPILEQDLEEMMN